MKKEVACSRSVSRAVVWSLVLAAFAAVTADAAQPFPCSVAVEAKARDFLENQRSFRLGFLPTEQSNPLTESLERDFRRSSADGVACLQRADRQVPIAMRHVIASPGFRSLCDAMEAALRTPKGRIVFTGCGATGRLSILLESMWRDFFARRAAELSGEERCLADRVYSIMTAGDFALIKSVEFFEDYMEGGAWQTDALGVGPGDVIIALNGGGECSAILGSLYRGVERGARGFMNVNNPVALLRRIERARKVIDDPRVTVLDFTCGPMALAGSTRMQSTTTQQFIYCAALETALVRIMPRLAKEIPEDFVGVLEDVLASLESPAGREGVAAAIEFEKGVYKVGGRITYLADDCMLDLFTDNTERSPTFMLPQLCSCDDKSGVQSWAFVKNPIYATSECWTRMLRREPRCLDGFSGEDARALGMPQRVIDNPPKIGRSDLMKYMIGNEPAPERIDRFPRAVAVTFSVGEPDAEFTAAAAKLSAAWPENITFHIGRPECAHAGGININAYMPPSPLEMWKHLAVKLVLNNLSTGTMAAMGRVAGNYMSWVSISNKKLTDRGVRLIRDIGHISYEEAAKRLFAAAEWIDSQDWTGKEKPCAVQVALEGLRGKRQEGNVEGEEFWGGNIGFCLHLGASAASETNRIVSSNHMMTRTVEKKDGKTRIVWRGHPVCGDGFAVTAELTPTPEGDGWAYTFRYEGNTSGMGVRMIDFPVLSVPRTDGTELLYPRACGQIRRPKWSSLKPGAAVAMAPACAFHFAAALNGEAASWYVDQRGDARLRPIWSIVRNGTEPETATLLFRYAPPVTDESRVAGALPFGGTIRRFKGDWFAAADIYRRWAWEQPWAKAAFARPQEKMRNIAIWFWNRGLIKDVIPPVERFAKATGLPVALDWYWWHKIPYDTGYPFFWPPREGDAAFRDAVARLAAAGIFVQPYTNGISWDWMAEEWETSGRPDAIMNEDGIIHGQSYNTYMPDNRLSRMCGYAPHFHRHMRGLMRTLRGTGLPGVYMDQVGGCTVRACWNPGHPHPPGGGTVIADGYRKLFEDIKADNPGFLISTEDTPEAYLDIVDSAINLWQNGERFRMPALPEAETIPVFQAIYHGALAVYGSYAVIDGIPPWDPLWPDEDRWRKEEAWEELYPDQYALEFARGVAMGMQPMVHQLRMRHFDDPRYAENFKFTIDTAKFYHANRDFLYDGKMCPPGTLDCARRPVELFIRGIYTKPEKARVVRHPSHPSILHSVWHAKDGRTAAVLCNWSRSEQKYAISTPDITAVGVITARSWKLVEKKQQNEGITK